MEVETLRLKDAMGRGRGGKSRQDGEADEDRETTDDGRSRAVRDAEEEVLRTIISRTLDFIQQVGVCMGGEWVRHTYTL